MNKLKSLNVNIPLSVALTMDERAQLNPEWVSHFLTRNLKADVDLIEPQTEVSYRYTFKVDPVLHKNIKYQALEHDMSIVEFTSRLFINHY